LTLLIKITHTRYSYENIIIIIGNDRPQPRTGDVDFQVLI